MEKWQEKLILKYGEINFLDDREEIKLILDDLCKPLLEGIKNIQIKDVTDKEETLTRMIRIDKDCYYVCINDDQIKVLREGKNTNSYYKFIINKNNQYAYLLNGENEYNQEYYKDLDSIKFDYREIINILMNEAVDKSSK